MFVINHCSLCLVQKRQDCPALQAKITDDFDSVIRTDASKRQIICTAVQRAEQEKADAFHKLD